ncbi:MAG TPA: AI-2E family transporter, partial [Bacteroidetes bacterium]|nr:AI-2E family transporter [Bacteroidota bacterium]
MNEENYPFFNLAIDRRSIQKAIKIFIIFFTFVLLLTASWIALTEFKDVSLIFLFSVLLAFLLDPPVGRLESRGLSRTNATFIVFLVILLIIAGGIYLLFPILSHQI